MKKTLLSLALVLSAIGSVTAKDHATDPDHYYLVLSDVVDSQSFLPTPPDPDSAHFAYDREQYEWGKALRDTERGAQAVRDADLSDGWIDRGFGEAFGFPITPADAPEIYRLIENLKEDAGDLATRTAKQHYMRPRPFVVFGEPTATPGDEPALRANGSYPSGHTSIGWATALVLAELNPERQTEILKRGYDFGQSRVIVGAHFQSDVDAGRVIGAMTVARLHADKGFIKRLEKSKKELKKLKKKQLSKR